MDGKYVSDDETLIKNTDWHRSSPSSADPATSAPKIPEMANTDDDPAPQQGSAEGSYNVHASENGSDPVILTVVPLNLDGVTEVFNDIESLEFGRRSKDDYTEGDIIVFPFLEAVGEAEQSHPHTVTRADGFFQYKARPCIVMRKTVSSMSILAVRSYSNQELAAMTVERRNKLIRIRDSRDVEADENDEDDIGPFQPLVAHIDIGKLNDTLYVDLEGMQILEYNMSIGKLG
jgi:hypothetical protein